MKMNSGNPNQGTGTQRSSLKCCWMLAGVVAYKLCDRGYECEKCSFDQAMVGPSRLMAGAGVSQLPEAGAAECLLFHDRHVWARVQPRGLVTTGLDDFGRRLTGRVYCVELPRLGSRIAAGGAAWTIVHHEGKVTLAAPVEGVVEKVNERLYQNPALINEDPYGAGWAVVLTPLDPVRDLKTLRSGSEAAPWIAAESERLARLVARAGGSHWTLPDGGRMVNDLHEVIPTDIRARILDLFLSSNTSRPSGLAEPESAGQ
jgi:glycine cleavage system H protein